jgi:hypothetical protein
MEEKSKLRGGEAEVIVTNADGKGATTGSWLDWAYSFTGPKPEWLRVPNEEDLKKVLHPDYVEKVMKGQTAVKENWPFAAAALGISLAAFMYIKMKGTKKEKERLEKELRRARRESEESSDERSHNRRRRSSRRDSNRDSGSSGNEESSSRVRRSRNRRSDNKRRDTRRRD